MSLLDKGRKETVSAAVFSELPRTKKARTSWMVPPPVAVPAMHPSAPAEPPPISTAPESLRPPPLPSFGTDGGPEPVAQETAEVQGYGQGDAEPEPVHVRPLTARPPQTAEVFAIPQAKTTQFPDARLKAALDALEAAIAEIGEGRAAMLASAEEPVIELAVAIARRVVARELATDRLLVQHLAVEGLAALADKDRVRVRFGEGLDETAIDVFREQIFQRFGRCEVLLDPTLGPGACIVETEYGRVDESVEVRLENVLRAVFPREPAPAPPPQSIR